MALATIDRGTAGTNRSGGIDGEVPDFRQIPLGPRTRQAVILAQRLSFGFARHWLALANGINLLVLATAAAVPIMMAAGWNALADPIFASYRLVCHQLPYRSFFLLGQQMAFCERDAAIYGAMGLAGLVVAFNRDRLKPLAWRWYLLALVPIGVDGLTQLVGLRESNWQLRIVTGVLFGAATVWVAYPRLQRFASEVLAEESARRARLGER